MCREGGDRPCECAKAARALRALLARLPMAAAALISSAWPACWQLLQPRGWYYFVRHQASSVVSELRTEECLLIL